MRGFALTVHCPRCGTAKPTGGDVAPLVTCVTCQLSFDPKPREPKARTHLPLGLVPVASSLVRVDRIDETETLLSSRESMWSGIWEVIVGGGFFGYMTATWGRLWWGFAVLFGTLCAFGLLFGVRSAVNRRYVRVGRDALEAWTGPMLSSRRVEVAGDLESMEIKRLPTRRYAVVVDGVELADVAREERAEELVQMIRFHRARLWERRDED